MEVSLGAVGNDLSRHEIWPSNRICLHGHVVKIHVVFLLCAASRAHLFCTAFARRFHKRQSTALLSVRSLFCMPSKMPQKRTRYALRKLAAAAKVLKKMCHVSLLTDALLGMAAVSLAACVTGRVIYWACVFLRCCQELCP